MLIAIPLLVVPVVIYNLVILLGGSAPDAVLGQASVLGEVLLRVPMTSGAVWSISVGDLILFLSLILLFVELLKSTSSQRVAIVNHAMVLFVVCLVEFLLLPGFAGSVFFLILTMVLLDVLAGFIVTIVASRRDFDMNPR